MRTAIETELITFDHWTLRIHPALRGTPRLLLLLHGFTGDESSMWVFARGLPHDYWMTAPRAPHLAETGGYSWRPSASATIGRPTLEMFRESAEGLIRLVDAYSASAGIEAGQFDVMGFSQGAAMSSLLALLHPHRIRKVGILAGFVPGGLEEIVSQHPLAGKQFFIAHGTKDEMVTMDRARASIALLEQAGAQVTYCEDEVGHKVSVNCLRALKNFFHE